MGKAMFVQNSGTVWWLLMKTALNTTNDQNKFKNLSKNKKYGKELKNRNIIKWENLLMFCIMRTTVLLCDVKGCKENLWWAGGIGGWQQKKRERKITEVFLILVKKRE